MRICRNKKISLLNSPNHFSLVEIVSTITFFFIGILVGSSLLDRLWLVGGVGMGYWASVAVHKESMDGVLVRKVGVQVAQVGMGGSGMGG